jgi:uncharacterized protein
MTPQEQEMIGDLVDRVQKTQLAEKDMDAEEMLRQGLGKNPDALYILAQTVLVQKYALEQAQAQLAEAKEQTQRPEPKRATSFLGSLLGRNEEPAPPPPPPPQQGYGQQQGYPAYAPVAVPQYGAPQYAPPMGMGGGGGGFLRGAMQTAAGVAAGALAFQGIESLMHGFGHAAGYGGQEFGSFGGGERPVEEVVNNYYGDEKGEHGGHEVSAAERAEGNREDLDYGSKSDRDFASSSGDAGDSDFDSGSDDGGSDLDDAGFDDGGSDFGDDSGGGDGDNFA